MFLLNKLKIPNIMNQEVSYTVIFSLQVKIYNSVAILLHIYKISARVTLSCN